MALLATPSLPVSKFEVPEDLRWAHPVVAEWFVRKFGTPTEPQVAGWPHILAGKATLISAPTGSGKTLAAFLIAIDGLFRAACEGRLGDWTEVVYVSPLKALSNDVQKNLEGPLKEIQELAMERGYLCSSVTTGVRTGDTTQKERRAMLVRPPHVLVTTPESLYILLTAGKSRENLRQVRTVIVDEVHAIADDKRGTHLALTLERLDSLVTGENNLSAGTMLVGRERPPQRIGLSATLEPLTLAGEFLVGVSGRHGELEIVAVDEQIEAGAKKPVGRYLPEISVVGKRRQMDIAIEIPSEALGAVTSLTMWEEVYDRIAKLAEAHRSTLVFVNTRRQVERIAFALSQRMGTEHVAAHHGSLSRHLRLEAEQKLKAGAVKVLVATASLELGIDIGTVDLVCQVNSCRALGVGMQRVGRAGHWRGAIPKGRFFSTTRDDLMECAALVRAMRAGQLDRLELPPEPLDVLMQQIVAMTAAEPWEEDTLFAVVKRAHPYKDLTRETFEELLTILTEGIASGRGRYGAYVLRDRVNGRIQARRGARTTAIGNGGTIPDAAMYSVVLQPEGVTVATLDEHFAVESSPGDVVQLGNSSWRILRVESVGRVLVEDAHGAAPTLPFWFGEAPARTRELSECVAALRQEISERTQDVTPGYASPTNPEVAECNAWLQKECGVDESAARQLIEYITAGRAVLGTVPTLDTIVAERFFDEGGGMQLILHAPFGGRINKAWGLALRKRFCRGFNFELQAAATDNGLNISLAEQHSFPLADVFEFLTEYTVKELLEQAALASPIFKARWRWDAGRSLQLIRFQNGKRVAPQIQRMRGDDLLASVFPQAAACFETIQGDIVIPDHALVREVMKDTLQEAMDLTGLIDVLRRMADGRIKCVAVDTTAPSVFSHELLNVAPYAYLDDADLQERRARAVNTRRTMPEDALGDATRLDPAAIASVRAESWPDIRDEHELHDLLQGTVAVPVAMALEQEETRGWLVLFGRLRQQGRATIVTTIDANGEWKEFWVAAERVAMAKLAFAGRTVELSDAVREFDVGSDTTDSVRLKMMQGWAPLLGPLTAHDMQRWFGVEAHEWMKTLLQMEMAGTMLRGRFERPAVAADDLEGVEWCERHVLQRIHRRTLMALRKQIEPVSPAEHLRWLLRWQHLSPRTQMSGEMGVLEALRGLAGFEAPAISWERELLTARVAHYDPAWLDALCLSGQVGWGRLSPHPALTEERAASAAPRAIVPTSVAPVTFFVREDADWMRALEGVRKDAEWKACLSPAALTVLNVLTERGACFLADVMRFAKLEKADAGRALWELAAAGLATADGFDNLRTLISPRMVRRGKSQPRKAGALGRWGLLGVGEDAYLTAGEKDEALASACRMLLRRYGVMFRELLARESVAPKWRDLVGMLRRMEARGEVRGGRFVTGFSGEQYALAEALEGLRAMRGRGEMQERVVVAATDPLNLIGITLPGDKVSVMPGRTVTYAPGAEFGMVAEVPVEDEMVEEVMVAEDAVPPVPATVPAPPTWTM
jgi:ATP-dependent helicase Lhr and Lhr-like helicase